MTNVAYNAHTTRMHAIGATPLSYGERVHLAMRCISLNVHEYKVHGINRYINQL